MSKICAFFGHRDVHAIPEVREKLEHVIKDLIDQGVEEFWYCRQGGFDCLVSMVLWNIKKDRKFIYISEVCPYPPSKSKIEWSEENNIELIYPNEVAKGPMKFAILRRNDYIVENVDLIVCYITHDYGGAYKAVEKARKKGLKIINLADKV